MIGTFERLVKREMLLDHGGTHADRDHRCQSAERVVAVTNRQPKLIGNQTDRVQIENVELGRILRGAVQNRHLLEHDGTNILASVKRIQNLRGWGCLCGNQTVRLGITESNELERLTNLIKHGHTRRNNHRQVRFASLDQHRRKS